MEPTSFIYYALGALLFVLCILYFFLRNETNEKVGGANLESGASTNIADGNVLLTGYLQMRENVIALKKKQMISNKMPNLLYVNESKINDFYKDWINSETITGVEEEQVLSRKAEISASLGNVGGKAGGDKAKKVTSKKVLHGSSLSKRLYKMQEHLLNNESLLFGLEEFNIKTLIKNFLLDNDAKFLPLITDKYETAMLDEMRLINNSDILISGDFRIRKQKEKFTITYDHPINEFRDNDKPIRFNIDFPSILSGKEWVLETIPENEERTISVFGRVTGSIRDISKKGNINIEPYAVYL